MFRQLPKHDSMSVGGPALRAERLSGRLTLVYLLAALDLAVVRSRYGERHGFSNVRAALCSAQRIGRFAPGIWVLLSEEGRRKPRCKQPCGVLSVAITKVGGRPARPAATEPAVSSRGALAKAALLGIDGVGAGVQEFMFRQLPKHASVCEVWGRQSMCWLVARLVV